MALERTVPALAVVGAYLGVRAWNSPQARFARMGGSSVVAPDGAAWVTDFLNAAYFRRRPELRQVDDLRLAFAILTTRWHRLGHRRLRAPDAVAFHNRLVLYVDDGQAFLRAAGTWDPMPWHIEQAYQRAGRDAQHAFWGQGAVETQSVLHQIARRTTAAAAAT
jgi:hypothetical protein